MTKETLNTVKDYYEQGVFPKSWVDNLLDAGKITKEEESYIFGNQEVKGGE